MGKSKHCAPILFGTVRPVFSVPKLLSAHGKRGGPPGYPRHMRDVKPQCVARALRRSKQVRAGFELVQIVLPGGGINAVPVVFTILTGHVRVVLSLSRLTKICRLNADERL